MRTVLFVLMLTTVALSGCHAPWEDGARGHGENSFDGSYEPDENLTKKPEKRFEPELRLRAEAVFLDKGDTVRLEYDVTDLQDYDFPITFIDWTITYEGEPNPIDEGDGSQLPGSYERVLYRDGFHNFTFSADDGQGLAENRSLSVWLGPLPEPPGEEGPAPEVYVHDWVAYTPIDCGGCVDSNPDGLSPAGYAGATACAGFQSGINHQDCTWVHLSEASWGHPFEVSSENDGVPELNPAGPGSVDVEFWEHCYVNEPDPEGDPSAYATGSLGHDFIDTSTDVAAGNIPEGAGCLVAFDYAWPTGGSTFHFQWTEDLGPGIDSIFETIPTIPTADGPCSIPLAQSCGPSTCEGLSYGWNGYGCAWVEVTPGMWGATVDIYGGDTDARILDSCSSDARVLGSFATDGPELDHTMPEGAGCLLAFEYTGAPMAIIFDIYHPE